MLAPGEQVGDWVVEEVLGEGGMGAVYRAHNALVPDIKAAVKVMKPIKMADARERFLREVQAVHRLQHPHIVRISGFGEDKDRGVLWMAMDLVEGGELTDKIGPGPMAAADAMRIFEGLVDALAHAHAMGVFHRDLKPSNVLIGAGDSPHLVDFGIASQAGLSKLTRTGTVIGTPSYMPPEVFEASNLDPARSDVYAAGQILFELLTGDVAFPEDDTLSDGQRMGRLLAAKAKAPALDPGPAVSPDIRALVRDATAPDPEQRIPTAVALRDRMRRLGPETRWVRTAPPPEAPQRLDGDSIGADTWGGGGERTWDSLGGDTEEAPKPTPPATPPPMQRPEPEKKKRGWGGLVAALVALLLTLIVGGGIALAAVAAAGAAWFIPYSDDPNSSLVAVVETDPPIVDTGLAPDTDTDTDADTDIDIDVDPDTKKAPPPPPPPPSSGMPRINRAAMTRTISGLMYQDTKGGSGATPEVGQTVEVHYTGWLENGTKFDSSRDRGQPFVFPFGQGRVIKGWDEGLATMRPGGRRLLVIPPDLAYGSRGRPSIPANSTLVFDVELVKIRADDDMPTLVRGFYGALHEGIANGDIAGAKEACQSFQAEHAAWIASDEGKRVWRRAGQACAELAVVGTRAPPMNVETWLQGQAPPSTAAQLVFFWEPWCPHCKRELPKMEPLQQRFKGKLTVVGLTRLNRNSTEQQARAMITDNTLSFPIGKDRGDLTSAFAVSGIPAVALVKDGIIVWRGHPGRLTDDLIRKLIDG